MDFKTLFSRLTEAECIRNQAGSKTSVSGEKMYVKYLCSHVVNKFSKIRGIPFDRIENDSIKSQN